MKAPKIVQAPEGCNDYLTAGKNYEVIKAQETINWFFTIIADNGRETNCIDVSDGHLNGKDWIIIERES